MRVELKGDAILFTKQASGSAKIDPLMAAFNAIALMSTNPWSARPSFFVIYSLGREPTGSTRTSVCMSASLVKAGLVRGPRQM